MAWTAKSSKSIGLNDLRGVTGGLLSGSGVVVNDNTALANAAFFACVRVLSQTMASLPLNLYQIGKDGKKKNINDSRTGRTLTRKPNLRQTTAEWIEQLVVHGCLDGNAINQVVKNGRGELLAVNSLDGTKNYNITELPDLTLRYDVTLPNGDTKTLGMDEVLHIKGLPYQTWRGIDMTITARAALGISIAATKHAETFYRNGSRPGGYLKTDKTLSNEAQIRLKQAWESSHLGAEKAHKVGVLEEGMEYVEMGVDLQKSQLIESRKYAVIEICSMFGVPPALVGSMDKATFSNVEELNRFFYNSTLSNWIKKIEDRINLLLPQNQCVEFDVSAFLRADPRTNADVGRTLFETASLTINENRQRNGLEPLEGGDVLAVQTNNVMLGTLEDVKAMQEERQRQAEAAAQAQEQSANQPQDAGNEKTE